LSEKKINAKNKKLCKTRVSLILCAYFWQKSMKKGGFLRPPYARERFLFERY